VSEVAIDVRVEYGGLVIDCEVRMFEYGGDCGEFKVHSARIETLCDHGEPVIVEIPKATLDVLEYDDNWREQVSDLAWKMAKDWCYR